MLPRKEVRVSDRFLIWVPTGGSSRIPEFPRRIQGIEVGHRYCNDANRSVELVPQGYRLTHLIPICQAKAQKLRRSEPRFAASSSCQRSGAGESYSSVPSLCQDIHDRPRRSRS